MPSDEEKGIGDEKLVGYAALSAFIADDKEHSSSVYRRYESLAARNILYLQSELRELEVELHRFDLEDSTNDDMMALAMDWQALRQQAGDDKKVKNNNSKAFQRQALVLRLRRKIKEYGEDHCLTYS